MWKTAKNLIQRTKCQFYLCFEFSLQLSVRGDIVVSIHHNSIPGLRVPEELILGEWSGYTATLQALLRII